MKDFLLFQLDVAVMDQCFLGFCYDSAFLSLSRVFMGLRNENRGFSEAMNLPEAVAWPTQAGSGWMFFDGCKKWVGGRYVFLVFVFRGSHQFLTCFLLLFIYTGYKVTAILKIGTVAYSRIYSASGVRFTGSWEALVSSAALAAVQAVTFLLIGGRDHLFRRPFFFFGGMWLS